MGSVFGLPPDQDPVHRYLYINWIFQWSWVLLGLDWYAFHVDIHTPNKPWISGCLLERMCVPVNWLEDSCITDVTQASIDERNAYFTHQECEAACNGHETKVFQFVNTVDDQNHCLCWDGTEDVVELREYVEDLLPEGDAVIPECWLGFTSHAAMDTDDASEPGWLKEIRSAQEIANGEAWGHSFVMSSLAGYSLWVYVPATFALLVSQMISCWRVRGSIKDADRQVGSDGETDSEDIPDDVIGKGFHWLRKAKRALKSHKLSDREKNTWEAGWFVTSSICVLVSQVATVGFTIFKYWQLEWVIPGTWFQQVTEIGWLVLVIVTATRMEYLKTRARMLRTIGLFGDGEDENGDHLADAENFFNEWAPDKAKELINHRFSKTCMDKVINRALKCNLWLSTRCEGERDLCWLIGCTEPIRHLWFVTIFLDWTQTFNYWYYDNELNGMDVYETFALPSLIFTIWGTSFLLVGQLSNCRALHMINNHQNCTKGQQLAVIENRTVVPGIMAVADFFLDEIPNMVLTGLFWYNGGLRGDQTTATMSIVQAVFAALTCFAHLASAILRYTRNDHIYVPKIFQRSRLTKTWIAKPEYKCLAMALTMMLGVVVGLLGPLLVLLHIVAVCANRATFLHPLRDLVDVLGRCLCCPFRVFCCCFDCCEECGMNIHPSKYDGELEAEDLEMNQVQSPRSPTNATSASETDDTLASPTPTPRRVRSSRYSRKASARLGLRTRSTMKSRNHKNATQRKHGVQKHVERGQWHEAEVSETKLQEVKEDDMNRSSVFVSHSAFPKFKDEKSKEDSDFDDI